MDVSLYTPKPPFWLFHPTLSPLIFLLLKAIITHLPPNSEPGPRLLRGLLYLKFPPVNRVSPFIIFIALLQTPSRLLIPSFSLAMVYKSLVILFCEERYLTDGRLRTDDTLLHQKEEGAPWLV